MAKQPDQTDDGPKPTLRVGFRVPFNELEPEPFASFVHGTLTVIGKKRNWVNFQQPDVGADEGFDSWATNEQTKRLVCVQCKRYSDRFSSPDLVKEVVKVALNAYLDGTNVGEHLVVTSGKVRPVLRKALREEARGTLKELALQRVRDGSNPLLDRIKKAGQDAEHLVTSYVTDVKFTVWSGDEFDTELGLVWDDIQSLVGRHFMVQPLVREYPRPDFDEGLYRQRSASSYARVPPWCDMAELPEQVRTVSAGDPMRRSESSAQTVAEPVELSNLVDGDTPGPLLLIIGEGGSGKSSALEIIREMLLSRRVDDGYDVPLPVLVQLGGVRGSFDASLHASLGIHRGHWSSLPGQILLLLDGLDEVGGNDIQLIQNEVAAFVNDNNVAKIVLTCRPSGPPRPFVASVSLVVRLLPLWARQVLEVAASVLSETGEAERFLDAWIEASQQDEYLSRPQAVAALLAYWRVHGYLPTTHLELLASVATVESKRAAERVGSLQPELQTIPYETVEQLARWLIEATWLKEGSSRVSMDDYTGHVIDICSRPGKRVLGLDTLGSLQVDQLLRHHGFARKTGAIIWLPHDTVCSFLAANSLGESWRDYIGSHSGRRYDRAWRAAVSFVPSSEIGDFLGMWLTSDVGMWCMLAMESGRRSEAEEELLRQAKQDMSDYRVAELAAALAMTRTDACLAQLRQWAAETGHSGRPVIARRSLARVGDNDILRNALRKLDQADSSPIRWNGEERKLWDASPIGARLAVAREEIRSSKDSNLGRSYRVVSQWGERGDAAFVRKAIGRAPISLEAFREGIFALMSLSRSDAIEEIEEALATAIPEYRIHIIGLAKMAGLQVPADQLLDVILAPLPELVNPHLVEEGDGWHTVKGGDPTENGRQEALKLIKDLKLSESEVRRILESINASEPTDRWAWSLIRVMAIPEGIQNAREILGRSGVDPVLTSHAAQALSYNGESGLAEAAKARFDEMFPDRLDAHNARSLFDLCAIDGAHEDSSKILGAVLDYFEKIMDGGARHLPLSFGRWADMFAKHKGAVEAVGALKILGWDMDMIAGVQPLIEKCFDLIDDSVLLEWLRGVCPKQWRHSLMRLCARKKVELRPMLARLLSAEIRESSRPRLEKALVEAARNCWCDELAEAVVETIVLFDVPTPVGGGRMLDPGARADDLQRQFWDLFTAEQGANYVAPAVGLVTNPDVREVLGFLRGQTQRRR